MQQQDHEICMRMKAHQAKVVWNKAIPNSRTMFARTFGAHVFYFIYYYFYLLTGGSRWGEARIDVPIIDAVLSVCAVIWSGGYKIQLELLIVPLTQQ